MIDAESKVAFGKLGILCLRMPGLILALGFAVTLGMELGQRTVGLPTIGVHEGWGLASFCVLSAVVWVPIAALVWILRRSASVAPARMDSLVLGFNAVALAASLLLAYL